MGITSHSSLVKQWYRFVNKGIVVKIYNPESTVVNQNRTRQKEMLGYLYIFGKAK